MPYRRVGLVHRYLPEAIHDQLLEQQGPVINGNLQPMCLEVGLHDREAGFDRIKVWAVRRQDYPGDPEVA